MSTTSLSYAVICADIMVEKLVTMTGDHKICLVADVEVSTHSRTLSCFQILSPLGAINFYGPKAKHGFH